MASLYQLVVVPVMDELSREWSIFYKLRSINMVKLQRWIIVLTFLFLSIEREELLETYRRLEHVFRVNMINN